MHCSELSSLRRCVLKQEIGSIVISDVLTEAEADEPSVLLLGGVHGGQVRRLY